MLCIERRVIIVAIGKTVAERRCSLAHAICHLDLEHLPSEAGTFERRQEAEADQLAARRLIPIEVLVDAVCWTTDPSEACAEMNVDMDMLRCRAEHLHPAERGLIKNALSRREAVA